MRWVFAALAIPLVLWAFHSPPDAARTYLDNSVPFVGGGVGNTGLDGAGIVVAVIDTGINYTHPDLYGFGPGGKVLGGHNFINPGERPMDRNGHGTEVAGIIAANGGVTGVAPAAGLLAYKVSEDGEGVKPDFIIRAVDMAVRDGADVINISLGINKTNHSIDAAVSRAVSRGVLVVVAAGNDGPLPGSIGSPGRNPSAITVGATYNNLTTSRIAVLSVDGEPYTVMPMLDSPTPDDEIEGPIVFGGHGRETDLEGVDAAGSILLVERGSSVAGELLYFSLKESAAADAGAAAIIVYNNEPGLFYGELLHEFNEPGYEPRIPAVSMGRSDGLEIIESMDSGSRASLRFFHSPDYPVEFSSRGPISPFYVKPDMMAPGAYINTTTSGSGYGVATGTSFAAPHVSGAAALLLQKHPGLAPEDALSLLASTSAGVVNETGGPASPDDAGTGRLDINAALASGLVIRPHVVVDTVTPRSDTVVARLDMHALEGRGPILVEYDIPGAEATHQVVGDAVLLSVRAPTGAEGRVTITHNGVPHSIPVLIRHTEGAVDTAQEGGRLHFDIWYPGEWSFAKITATSKGGQTHTTSTVPGGEAHVDVYSNALYYIQADIVSGYDRHVAYDTIRVDSVSANAAPPVYEILWRPVAVVGAVVGAVGAIGAVMRVAAGGPRRSPDVRGGFDA